MVVADDDHRDRRPIDCRPSRLPRLNSETPLSGCLIAAVVVELDEGMTRRGASCRLLTTAAIARLPVAMPRLADYYRRRGQDTTTAAFPSACSARTRC